MKHTITTKGMHCPSCALLVKEALADIGVDEAAIDYKTGKVTVETKIPLDKIKQAITAEGYEVL
jgi:copper chaperone CopZ